MVRLRRKHVLALRDSGIGQAHIPGWKSRRFEDRLGADWVGLGVSASCVLLKPVGAGRPSKRAESLFVIEDFLGSGVSTAGGREGA